MIILINNELWQVIVYSDVVCPNITKKSKNPRTQKIQGLSLDKTRPYPRGNP